MLRNIAILLMPTMLFLATPTRSDAQLPPFPGPAATWRAPELSGRYVSQNGGQCFVDRRGESYVFTNDTGQWAQFVFVGPGRLGQVRGKWDPSVVATVQHDRFGRVVLRFDSPNAATGYWWSEN